MHNDRCVYKTDCPCSHQAHLDLQRLSLVWTDDCSKRYHSAAWSTFSEKQFFLPRYLFKLAHVWALVYCQQTRLALKVRHPPSCIIQFHFLFFVIAKSLLLTNTSPSSVLPSPDIVVVTTTPNSVAVVKDKAFQLCCNTVHGMGRTSPRYQW